MAGDELAALCRIATTTVSARGHHLDEWGPAPGEELARRAVCVRCGRAVYARTEPGLTGVAGRALTEPCVPSPVPPATA
jgi:hypothetical protein